MFLEKSLIRRTPITKKHTKKDPEPIKFGPLHHFQILLLISHVKEAYYEHSLYITYEHATTWTLPCFTAPGVHIICLLATDPVN